MSWKNGSFINCIDFAEVDCLKTEASPRGYGFLFDQFNLSALLLGANLSEGGGRFPVDVPEIVGNGLVFPVIMGWGSGQIRNTPQKAGKIALNYMHFSFAVAQLGPNSMVGNL